ncbi:MAG TPA: AMP-binding protein, partial [Thermoanaerobaculia bacterium]|nr:AMP-binding protein [Thermoanaerobaculia bacterium]
MKALPRRSVPELFLERVRETPDAPAFLHPENGAWTTLSWSETGRRVRELSCGLLSLGLSAGETAAIVSTTRIEWVVADLAILCAGAVT